MDQMWIFPLITFSSVLKTCVNSFMRSKVTSYLEKHRGNRARLGIGSKMQRKESLCLSRKF